MRKKFSNSDVSLLFGLLFVAIAFGTVWFSFRGWPLSPAPESLPLVKTEGLKWCEVYFYGPSDNEIRERYNGSDEKRTLVLLDGRPEEFPPYDDINNRFQGGDLYRMANEFNYKDFIEINALPEDSPIVFTTNILQFPALTLCNSANGGKALIFRRFRHLPFGRVIRISRRIPA